MYKKALCFGDFDIIIASVHNLRNRPDFYYMDFKKEDAHIILDMYFDELLETASFDSFCTLAHLTYPLRYIKRDTGVIPSLSPYRDKIDLIYETLIKRIRLLKLMFRDCSRDSVKLYLHLMKLNAITTLEAST